MQTNKHCVCVQLFYRTSLHIFSFLWVYDYFLYFLKFILGLRRFFRILMGKQFNFRAPHTHMGGLNVCVCVCMQFHIYTDRSQHSISFSIDNFWSSFRRTRTHIAPTPAHSSYPLRVYFAPLGLNMFRE